MLEGVKIEVGAELTVQHLQDVLVELSGDAAGVVVGGLEPIVRLDQIGAEQEAIVRPHQGGEAGEKVAPGRGVEVADRAAEEGDQATALAVGDALEVVLEVADEAAHGEARVLPDQRLGSLVGDLLGDVDRDVGLQAAGIAHRAEQVAGLCRRAGAELDQRLRPAGGGNDLAAALGEDRALGPGRVVLGQLGDLLEQLRAALVVEVLRRQLLGLGRESGANIASHRRGGVGSEVDLDRDHASLAQRMPEKIWRRSGRSQLRKLGRITLPWVAQEPPRSTL